MHFSAYDCHHTDFSKYATPYTEVVTKLKKAHTVTTAEKTIDEMLSGKLVALSPAWIF